MGYVLKNKKTKMYFKGYLGKGAGKKFGNKPTWIGEVQEAAQYDLELALRTEKRLDCQSQFVDLISVK